MFILFCEHIFDLNLNQLIDQPTHTQRNIPDPNAADILHSISVDTSK